MRILVTGGAGYLGSSLVPILIERGHNVRVFDRFCFGEEPLRHVVSSQQCEVVHGDVRRLDAHPGLLDGIETIIHLAGLANDPSCDLDPEMAFDVNVEGTRHLVCAAIRTGGRRFVLASSCSVYGKGVFDLVDEQSPPNPVSVYAETKRAAEEVLAALCGDAFEMVVARPATLFGWSPRMRFDLAINQMAATAVRQGRITVRGGGAQWRPFIHVCDAARAFALLVEAPSDTVCGQIFNIGCDAGNFVIRDLAEHVGGILGNVPVETARDDEDRRSYRVQFGKFQKAFTFEPEYTVRAGALEIEEKLRDAALDPFDEVYFNLRRMKRLLATPVAQGGEPVAARFVPLAQPSLGVEEEEAAIEAMRSGWLTSGPQLDAFEKAFCETVGAAHTVPVCSCTAALHLCLAHLGVGPGDEVVMSPITWASAANTVVNMGAKVVFADVVPDTLNIDPDAVARAVTARTKAIMPVHLAGHPCDLDAVYDIGNRHGIPVVEDAAHALGASYKRALIGSSGQFACFSFYAVKNITTIEGGAVAVKDDAAAQELRLLAANGIRATAWDRRAQDAAVPPPEVVRPGYKYLMGNVSAAIGIEQLKKLERFCAARQRLARMYHTALSDIDEIVLPAVRNDVTHAWHLFIIRLRLEAVTKTRDEIAHALHLENIGTGVHFFGLHLHQYYRETLGIAPEQLPEASKASYEILSLPLYPAMTDKHVRQVAEALKKILTHARK